MDSTTQDRFAAAVCIGLVLVALGMLALLLGFGR